MVKHLEINKMKKKSKNHNKNNKLQMQDPYLVLKVLLL